MPAVSLRFAAQNSAARFGNGRCPALVESCREQCRRSLANKVRESPLHSRRGSDYLVSGHDGHFVADPLFYSWFQLEAIRAADDSGAVDFRGSFSRPSGQPAPARTHHASGDGCCGDRCFPVCNCAVLRLRSTAKRCRLPRPGRRLHSSYDRHPRLDMPTTWDGGFAIAVFCCWGLSRIERGNWRRGALAATWLASIATVFSGTRSAIAAIDFGCFTLAVASPVRLQKRQALSVVAAAGAFVLFYQSAGGAHLRARVQMAGRRSARRRATPALGRCTEYGRGSSFHRVRSRDIRKGVSEISIDRSGTPGAWLLS